MLSNKYEKIRKSKCGEQLELLNMCVYKINYQRLLLNITNSLNYFSFSIFSFEKLLI